MGIYKRKQESKKKENKNSTKKAVKKTRKKKENKDSTKKKNLFFLDHFLGRVLGFFLVFLFFFINSHLRGSIYIAGFVRKKGHDCVDWAYSYYDRTRKVRAEAEGWKFNFPCLSRKL